MNTSSKIPSRWAAAALLTATLAAPAAVRAQGVPSDSVLSGFQKSGDYVLLIDGKHIPAAEIYLAERVPAFLVMTSALPSPVLISPRSGMVETVHIMKVSKKPDGSVDLLADAVLAPVGKFAMNGENVTFSVQAKKASLNPKPPLIGLKKNADLKTHNPEYARTAKGYSPNSQALAALKKETKPVVVRIFFGSWCPHCRDHVPFILRVEDELKANPKIKFEYVGMPRSMDTPEAKQFNIREVPTGLVFIGGKEVGRIRRDDWNAPEVQLSKLVKGGGAAPAKSK